MAGHKPFSDLIDKMPPDRRAQSDQRVQELRWRRHPLWGPLTRADGLAMLYGAVSGSVYMYLEDASFLPGILMGAFVGFFTMLWFVGLSKVFLIWEYMRVPLLLVNAARVSMVGFLAFVILAAAASGDWPIAAAITWVLLPLLLIFCHPKPNG